MGERAAQWFRVSSGKQDEKNQFEDVSRHCVAHGYEIAREPFVLHDRSAYHGEQQPALEEMLADMRAGRYQVLVIWHSDRLERREGKALLDVLAEVREAGGRVESVKEPMLGQLDFGGQVTTFITGLVNHEKSRHLAEQIGLAKDRIAANGALDGRMAWGFTSAGPKYDRRLVPTAQAREYIPAIFDRIISGQSLAQVCRWLEAQGVAPVGIAREREDGKGKSGQWWPRSLGQLIRNPVYKGIRVDGNGQTVTKVEALVDAATWAAAGKRLDKRPKRGPVLRENRCALSGAVKCWACGGPMYRLKSGNGGPWYLRCAGTGPARKSCGVPMVRLDTAEALADEVLGGLRQPVYAVTLIPGNEAELDARLAALDYERRQLGMRGLSWDDEDTERSRLRKAYELVQATPRIAARRAFTDTGVSYGGRWLRMGTDERAGWLRSGEVLVHFIKGEADRAEGVRDGVSLVLTWLDQDEIAA